jgi:hypothetical protein
MPKPRSNGAKMLVTTLPPGVSGNIGRRNKYRAKPTIYNGVRYASKAEANRAEQLDQLRAAGEVHWWVGQVRFRLGIPENVYVVDFLVVDASGVFCEDVKGVSTAKFKRDVRLWKRYGPCPLHVIRGRSVEVVEGGGERCPNKVD